MQTYWTGCHRHWGMAWNKMDEMLRRMKEIEREGLYVWSFRGLPPPV